MFAVSMLEIFGGLLGAGLFLALVVWFINSRAAKDMWAGGRAQVGKLGHAAVSADPKAVFEQEVRDARDALNVAITDLEESRGLVTELQDQVKRDQREVSELDGRVRNSLQDDPEDKRGKAADYVVKLEVSKERLLRDTSQLTQAQTIYANNLKKFQLAQKKIDAQAERGHQLGSEVKSSEVSARLAKLAQKFNVDVGSLGGRLSHAEDEMRHQIAKNNAVSEVQTDLGLGGLAEAEEEERLAKADAKNKLEEYRKSMGLTK